MAIHTPPRAPAAPDADRSARTRTLTALAACGLLIGGLIAGFVAALPPTIQVQLDPQAIRPSALGEVVGPDPVAAPEPADDRGVGLMLTHLRANPTSREWNDLHRAGTNTDLAVLNTAVDRLARGEKTPPNRFRELPEGEQRSRLRAALGGSAGHKPPARAARTNADIATAVADGVNPGPPPEPNWWRRQVGPLFGLSANDRQRWEDAVAKAVREQEPQIRALHRKYQAARSVPDRVLVSVAGEEYQAVPGRDADRGAAGVVWNQNRAAVDCDLSVRSKAGTTRYTRTTGVRLLSVPVATGDDTAPPELSWPPAACAVDEGAFRTFLRGAGFPAKLTPRGITVQPGGTAAAPTFRIHFRAESDDFPGWSQAGTLQLAGKPLTEQAAEVGEAALDSLRRFAPTATKLGANAALVKRLPGGDFAADLTPVDGPRVTMRCAIDSTGGLLWTGPHRLKDAEALVDWMVVKQPQLKGARADLRVGGVRLDADGRLAGDLVLPPTPAAARETSVPFSVSPAAVVLELPKEWKAPPEAARAPGVWGKAQARQAITDEIQSAYPAVAPWVEVEAVGDSWVLGVRVGDWPVLRVGPFRATSAAEGRAVVHDALSERSVKEAAKKQWKPADPTAKKTTIPHPKYGEVSPRIRSWDAADGRAVVTNRIILWEAIGDKLPLQWDETGTCTAADGWAFNDPVVEMAEKYAEEHLFNPLRQAALDSTGGKFDFAPDRRPDGRWLTLAPVTVRLKARMQIPLPCDFDAGVRLEANGVTLDRTGLQFVEKVRATLEGFTLSLPEVGVALSDPYVMFHNTPKGTEYSLGVLITPPLTPVMAAGMFPNPWTYLFCLRAEAGIRFREPELRLEGTALLLRRLNNDAAFGTAKLVWTIPTDKQAGVVTGTLMASGQQANIPFEFGGTARFDSTGVSLKGVLQLPEIGRTDARLTVSQLSSKTPRADVTATGRMLGQRLDLKGWMTVDLVKLKAKPDDPLAAVDYHLHGEARLPASVLHVLVTPKDGVRTWLEVKVDGTTIQKLFTLSWGNGDADQEAVRREVEAIKKEVRQRPYDRVQPREESYLPPPPPDASPTPNQVAARTPPPPPPPPKVGGGGVGIGGGGSGTDPAPALVFDRVAPGSLMPVDEPYGDNPPQIYFKYFTDDKELELAAAGRARGNRKDGLILTKKDFGLEHVGRVGGKYEDGKGFEEFDDRVKCNYVLWPLRDGSGTVVRGSLLVTDHVGKKVRLLTTKTRDLEKGTTQEVDLTDTFRGMTPLFFDLSGKFTADEKKAYYFHKLVVVEYADSLVRGSQPREAPQKVDGGKGGYKYTVTAPDAIRHTVLVRPDEKLKALVLNVDGSAIPHEGHTPALLRRLSVMKAEAVLDHAWVVAAEADGRERVAVVQSTLTDAGRDYTFRPSHTDKPIPITDLHAEKKLDRNGIHAAAGRLAGVLWKANAVPTGVFVGPRGVMAVTADGFWVVPDGEKPQGWFVPKGTFIDWAKGKESARFLPAGWRTPAERQTLTADAVADAVLADWEADRRRDVKKDDPEPLQKWVRARREAANAWDADPLGLILGIAELK